MAFGFADEVHCPLGLVLTDLHEDYPVPGPPGLDKLALGPIPEKDLPGECSDEETVLVEGVEDVGYDSLAAVGCS